MKILIIGGGGREHALAEAYGKSKRVKKVFVAPGNGLVDYQNEKVTIVSEVKALDLDGILTLVKKEKIGLVDVAQDDPLAAGFVDRLQALGIVSFGPTQRAAEIEWNKEWAREFMVKYGLPTPHFKSFTNQKEAIDYVEGLYVDLAGQTNKDLRGQTLFVKASGLALGKGVIKATNKEEAIEAIKQMSTFGRAGEKFLIEEGLIGEEFSLFAICDGKDYQIVSAAQDHKTIYDADQGSNTGGMGCVAPAGVLNSSIVQTIELKILKPFMTGMLKEGRSYVGVLYLGGMVTHSAGSGQAKGVKVIEFNARWGDPEAEVILPSIKIDYVDLIEAVLEGKLDRLKIGLDEKVRLSVAGCSRGYPTDYSAVKGKEIFGLIEAMKLPGITIYGAGIKREGNRFFANGGRVFHLVAEGNNIIQARARVYGAMAMIDVEGDNLHYRTDIGWREVARLRK